MGIRKGQDIQIKHFKSKSDSKPQNENPSLPMFTLQHRPIQEEHHYTAIQEIKHLSLFKYQTDWNHATVTTLVKKQKEII